MLFADVHSTGNSIEAVFWFVIAAVLLVVGARQIDLRSRCWMASVTLIAFGISDIVEIETGAWWRPWWLFAWKGACIVSFMWLWWLHRTTKHRVESTAV